jgi:murein DD-endopeptidase MepM/ murein hydrolase activator NlpD
MARPTYVRFLILALVLSVAAAVWVLQRWAAHHDAAIRPAPNTSPSPLISPSTAQVPSPEPTPSPSVEPTLAPSIATPSAQASATTAIAAPPPADEPQTQSVPEPETGYVGRLKLLIPVLGVKPDQLHDTFDEARSEGRVHDAIDIPAAQGTPVLAAADGPIVKLFQSVRGGTTIYQLSNDKKLVYYYAHLQRYADDIVEGKFVEQGHVIAYVGDTGNAGQGNYHLHFSIALISDPKRYWEGTNINPYPLLRH